MIIRNGLALTIPVLFSSGAPDGNISWRLLGTVGEEIAAGTVAVPVGSVSVNLSISSDHNLLPAGALFASRDFEWSYTSGGVVVNGEQRYTIEARVPYGASNDGVRSKLGVEPHDLPDGDISLVKGYIFFRSTVTPELMDAVTDPAVMLMIREAIEAQTALSLIPTMAVRVAVQEDSGTNMYKRQNIEWGAIAETLSAIVDDGLLAVNPVYDATPTGSLFILATPATDPFTGDAYSTG